MVYAWTWCKVCVAKKDQFVGCQILDTRQMIDDMGTENKGHDQDSIKTGQRLPVNQQLTYGVDVNAVAQKLSGWG